MPAQLNIFLLLFGGLQGLLLSLFLIKKKLYRSAYVFLLLYFAVMLLQIALKVMNKVWLMTNWGFLYEVSYYLPLLYGPLIFLFARNLFLEKRFRSVDLLHFLPFALLIIFLSLSYIISFTDPAFYFFYQRKTGMIMQLISLFAYHALAFQHWRVYRQSLENYFSETHRMQISWIRQIIVASFVVCAAVSVAIYLIYITHPKSLPFRYWFAVLTVFIYWVSYTALTKPFIFSVIKSQSKGESPASILLPKLVVHRPAKKYSNSGLSEEEVLTINTALPKIISEQKPYLNPELTINDLAALVKCNRHHLSQMLNENLHQSFYDYINNCRVEEAKQLLLDPAREDHKIASIAYDAGFNSLSTFNDVFRKKTGTTPSLFRKEIHHASQQQIG